MDVDNGVGINCGSRGGGGEQGRGGQRGKNWDNCKRITILKKKRIKEALKNSLYYSLSNVCIHFWIANSVNKIVFILKKLFW